MKIFYLKVNLFNSRNCVLKNSLCLMIAEDEDSAILQMKNILKLETCEISIPENASELFGHGYEVSKFLDDPQKHQKFRELLDSYCDHYNRYDLQVFDQYGEVIIQNAYSHVSI